MKRKHFDWLMLLAPLAMLASLGACDSRTAEPSQNVPAAIETARPALTVRPVSPAPVTWAKAISASGSITAWQETIVGSEIGGLRIAEVRANVGDKVKKGQVLVVLADDVVQADLAQVRASLQEARAVHAEARANADRARRFQPTGMMSQQQVTQYLTAEQTAKARIEVAAARLQLAELRIRQTRIVAPDDALISARMAAVGTVPQAGQELFRLILRGRVEWRAEVRADDIGLVRPGDLATLSLANGAKLSGKVRSIAPSVDPQTRNGLVYVDVSGDRAKAGMFANGEIVLGAMPATPALSLPQSAVLLRDGFAHVFRIGPDHRLSQTRVVTGRRQGDRVEILSGIEAGEQVVESGVGFLSDGDQVEVTSTPPTAAATPG
ncbi:efflux RND transporter periplasmic adaptor subunit [Aromatoleum diolicum]|uniref:Efflux RND transporter periplasmic adaptor subunit n=1 Tax=Aromatoleum diolicum TaxID=75796 RepID=A0ABX1QHQ0_9RHOO|nr:efflux RND transporter periplasmic adaptor subunit [Aromatoleum diolicum]NMG76996.1 efflux RND transporter periplasmic adaptor subunit [Aromatoleum diolicum]